MRIVVAEGGDMVWLAGEETAVCMLVSACDSVSRGVWRGTEEVRSMEGMSCRCGHSR